jgi:DNA polymerase-1
LLYRTVTGRTSIIDPPIQQIPQRGEYRDLILDIFVAEEGWLFGSRDLSQSELRIMGWLAQDPVIMDALKKGIDLHTLTASNVMRIPLDKVTKSDRQKAKPINFGFIYGMQASTFVEYAKDEYGIVYTLKEAEQFREAYFNTYKAIRGFHNYMSRVVSENGFVYTPLGRKRRLPGIHSKDYALRSMAIRQAINTPVQAFSSDLALLGMKLFQDAIESSSTLRGNVKILWFKHDEIFFTAKKEVMNEAMKVLKSCMEHRVKVYIHKHFGLVVDYPIETDGKVGKSWWRLKPVK